MKSRVLFYKFAKFLENTWYLNEKTETGDGQGIFDFKGEFEGASG